MLHELRRFIYGTSSFVSSDRRPTKDLIRAQRVGYFTHNLRSQGAQNSLLEIAGAIHDSDRISARLYSPGDDVLRDAYEQRGIKVTIFPRPNAGEPDIDDYKRNLDTFASWLAQEKLDVIHANTVQTFYVIQAARLAGIPCVWNIREGDPPENFLSQQSPHIAQACRSSFQLADAVVFVSNNSKEIWENAVPVNNPRVFHNSLNPATWATEIVHHDRYTLRSALDLKVDDKLIITTGTVSERKAQLDLVKAIECDPELLRSASVAIVGMNRSAYAQNLSKRVGQLPDWARERVFLIKERPIAEVVPFYLAADLFVFCSRVESFPRSLLEAFFFGLPAITTNCNGIPEFVSNNINGLFYREGDHEQLAHFIRSLLQDEEQFRRMRLAAWSQSREHRNFDDTINRYKRVYAEISSPKRSVSE